ncbi:hypothetical protein [Staphylococcus pasteuri]
MLGISKGARIIRQRMIVIGNGPNIEMFEVEVTFKKNLTPTQ